MAITLTCPRCTHKNTVDESKANKPIHCRICHHVLHAELGSAPTSLAPSGGTPADATVPMLDLGPAEPPSRALAPEAPLPMIELFPSEDERERVTTKERPAPPLVRAPAKEKRRGDRDDRDDVRDEDRRRPERRSGMSGGAIALWLLAGAGVLMLLGCCVSVPALFFVVGHRKNEVAVAVNDPPRNNQPVPNDNDVIVINPPPIIINPPLPPPIVVNPPPPKLNAQNPDEVKQVLDMLKTGRDLDEAFRWLKTADPNNPSRQQVAQQLERMVEDQKRVAWSNDNFFAGYFRWATRDNFPSLVQMVQDPTFTVDANHRRQKSIETLGKLKDERGAEAIVLRLDNFFDRDHAQRAVEELGSLAQPALLKHMNSASGDLRNNCRKLLLAQQETGDAMLTQTVADMGAAEEKVRNAALEWLLKTPMNEKRRSEVSHALDRLINPQTLHGDLIKVLELWGTTENGLTVANNIDNGNVFRAADQIKLLGKLKDPRTLPALTSRIGQFGFVGNAAQDALKQFGSAAEPEVVKLLTDPDNKLRTAACKVLAHIGTAEVSVPALQRALEAFPKDGFFPNEARKAIQSIQVRAGANS
jgi:HEAT repeat protein